MLIANRVQPPFCCCASPTRCCSFSEKQVNVNEHNICYLEGGIATTSVPILFLHGWAVGTVPYQEVLNILCQRYKVIAPELPGFGKSSGSQLDWDYNKFANFIIAF